MTAALAGLGPEPVTHLINTHWHFDHADGNQWLHELGPKILAHERTREHLSALTRVEDWDFDFPPFPAGALPTDVFATERTLELNGTTVALRHLGPGHTDGDIVAAFEEPGIVHAGDLYWNGSYPFIDHSTGGSIDGTIRAVEALLAATTDRTIIVPGHGHPVSGKAELDAYRAMLVGIRENVAGLKKQGRTLDETIAAKPTAAYDAKWGGFVIGPAFFTRLAYAGV
jgi:glyoxylase-like metal-dependent hydrolase (beta-lactamase superfamily II)